MMKSTQTQRTDTTNIPSTERSYQEITAYLDAHWQNITKPEALRIFQTVTAELSLTPQKQNAIIISGTNGKSLTAHFTTRLLQSEGLTVGTLISPHTTSYTERISLNGVHITTQEFVEVGNAVLQSAEANNITLPSLLVLDAISLLYFTRKKADIIVIENSSLEHGITELYAINTLVVTRITSATTEESEEKQLHLISQIRPLIQNGTHVISGDQLKTHLQALEDLTAEQHGIWEMPIRKLAPLGYPFEQIHGRCAALAERAASIYMNSFGTEAATVINESLLVKQKGKRGRPTLEAKQDAKLNPKKTIDQFWKTTCNELPSRFELRDDQTPAVLLDSADNLDALENLLLGTRLLHYKRPIKNLTIIMNAEAKNFDIDPFVRAIRYFFKKTPGQIFICPLVANSTPWTNQQSWDIGSLMEEFTNKKVKASAFNSFEQAFAAAKEFSDPKEGLIVVTGSASIIANYWKLQTAGK